VAIQEITLGDFAKLAIRRGLNERTVNHGWKFFNNSSTNHARSAFDFRSTANPRNIDHAEVLMVVQVFNRNVEGNP
jgi:hypothetical protein